MPSTAGFVYIIESPSANDILEERTEGKALSEFLRLAQIPYHYNLVTNQETFYISLGKRLVNIWQHFNIPPILHFSMHGSNEGVVLTDDTSISWVNLWTLLEPLNKLMEGGLLICMSSCFGSFGYQMAISENQEMPFWALVGNNYSVSWSDAAVAYFTFYHLFFKGISVEDCVMRMKIASDDNDFEV